MKIAGIYYLVFLCHLLVGFYIEDASASSSLSVGPPTPVLSATVNASASQNGSYMSVSTVLTTKQVSPSTPVGTSSYKNSDSPSTVTEVPVFSSAMSVTAFVSSSAIKPSATQVPVASSSVEPTPTKPTPQPQPAPTKAHGSHFDVASFFGGIILASALIIGGFFIWRFFKNRRSYHHL